MPQLSGIHHIALTVPDAEASATFYGRLLGLDEVFRIDDDTLCARVFGGELGATYTPTVETPFGAVVVFRDPDGIQIEFFVTENGS